MKCEVCGENMAADAVFCPKCGERRKTAAAAAPQGVTGVDKLRQSMASKLDPKTDEPEAVLWQGSYSPKAMIGGWLLSFVVTIVACVAGAFFGPIGWFVAAIISLAVWGGHLALLIYQRLSHEYKLTSQRFVHSSGILRRITDRIEVIDIDDVQVTQGFVEHHSAAVQRRNQPADHPGGNQRCDADRYADRRHAPHGAPQAQRPHRVGVVLIGDMSAKKSRRPKGIGRGGDLTSTLQPSEEVVGQLLEALLLCF
jgi:hypothetical protein